MKSEQKQMPEIESGRWDVQVLLPYPTLAWTYFLFLIFCYVHIVYNHK